MGEEDVTIFFVICYFFFFKQKILKKINKRLKKDTPEFLEKWPEPVAECYYKSE